MSENQDFHNNKFDFGLTEPEFELNEWQKKMAALAMGTNAAIVQFILEGLIPLDEQLHFMSHLQDYTARIYNGESIKLPETGQTLQINSKAGTLFYKAAEDALVNGQKNHAKLKQFAAEAVALAEREGNTPEQQNNDKPKPTVH